MSFGDRIDAAHQLEQRVIAGLRARGWLAYPFGQAQIPEDGRDVLRRYMDDARRPSLLRWMPDIIALREDQRPELALIDAKNSGGPRYAIETRSIEAAEVFVAELHTPVFFVCEDGGVLTPRDVRERGFPGPVKDTTGGSGTPYVLVEKRWASNFNDIFGHALPTEQAA
jgi:hypothetical protein